MTRVDWAAAIKRFYGPFEPFARRLGLHPIAVQSFDALERWVQPNEVTVSLGHVSARFSTPTQGEYWRVTKRLERDILADVIEHVEPDDVFWDVGASTGPFTCLLAEVLHSGSVVAFEPHPENIASLRRNVTKNGYDNVRTEAVALSNETGDIDLAINSREAGTGLHAIYPSEDRETTRVQMQRGDDLVTEGFAAPTVVKIDVEGSEQLVVDGMRRTLGDDRCRLLYCEVHGDPDHPNSLRRYDTTPEQFLDDIEELGFELTVISKGQSFTIRGEKP